MLCCSLSCNDFGFRQNCIRGISIPDRRFRASGFETASSATVFQHHPYAQADGCHGPAHLRIQRRCSRDLQISVLLCRWPMSLVRMRPERMNWRISDSAQNIILFKNRTTVMVTSRRHFESAIVAFFSNICYTCNICLMNFLNKCRDGFSSFTACHRSLLLPG